jgi:hypothetical protein
MTKLEQLTALLEADEPFMKAALDPQAKLIKKAGARVNYSGKNATIVDPKTKRKVQFKDTGKEVKITRIENNKPVVKDVKSRGAAGDLLKELDWAAGKE